LVLIKFNFREKRIISGVNKSHYAIFNSVDVFPGVTKPRAMTHFYQRANQNSTHPPAPELITNKYLINACPPS
jgi:hypothetical protein